MLSNDIIEKISHCIETAYNYNSVETALMIFLTILASFGIVFIVISVILYNRKPSSQPFNEHAGYYIWALGGGALLVLSLFIYFMGFCAPYNHMANGKFIEAYTLVEMHKASMSEHQYKSFISVLKPHLKDLH
jgi:hypothetical protein